MELMGVFDQALVGATGTGWHAWCDQRDGSFRTG